MYLMLTCEHASNHVPPDYRYLFASARAKAALSSHRGYDIGARELAEKLHSAIESRLFLAQASRLLVDVNRSLHHRHVFSEFSRALSHAERLELINEHYWPYRRGIEDLVEQRLREGDSVLHIAVHSFTPVLAGRARNADVGLLYDPGRAGELQTCRALARLLAAPAGARSPGDRGADLRVRRNYPYRGVDDGLTTALRRRFSDAGYRGIEIELNQGLLGAAKQARRVAGRIAGALARVLADGESM